MIEINILNEAGAFAENKDIARDLRESIILPNLKEDKDIIINFNGVEGATQSFIHALISEAIRIYGPESLEKISFKNCNETTKKIISIVTDYMQQAE
jgi:hypothetical protein